MRKEKSFRSLEDAWGEWAYMRLMARPLGESDRLKADGLAKRWLIRALTLNSKIGYFLRKKKIVSGALIYLWLKYSRSSYFLI